MPEENSSVRRTEDNLVYSALTGGVLKPVPYNSVCVCVFKYLTKPFHYIYIV